MKKERLLEICSTVEPERESNNLNLGGLSKLADPDIALRLRGKCQLSSN